MGLLQATVLGILLAFRLVHAVPFYHQNTIPSTLTAACGQALKVDVACDWVVPSLKPSEFYPTSTLARVCTAACTSALASFQNGVATACNGQKWQGYDNETMPVAVIPELVRYAYNLTCLQDSNRFCNNVAAAYAASLDTTAAKASPPAGGQYGGLVVTDPCDKCLIKNLQFQAGSPYYDGPDLLASSVYQSKTSSCKVTGMPLTTTALTIFTPTTPAAATPTCAGSSYTVTAQDTCHSISLSQGIGTSWLLQDNHLAGGCANFPKSGTLCLVNKCKVYTVKTNETCDGIASSQRITVAQLKAWNPSINAGCYNVNSMVGDQLCVAQPGTPYVPPSTPVTLAPTIPTTAAPVPTNVAAGSNTVCGQYYEVVPGDFCNKLTFKFGLSLEQFIFLNPTINANCTNLFAFESYCVQAVGDINTYSGQPGYQTYTATFTGLVGDPVTRLPAPNYTPSTRTTSRLPLATGTRADCFTYFDGSFFDVNRTSKISECQRASSVLFVSLEDLAVWNPSLGNTKDASCKFDGKYRYCGKYYIGDVTVNLPSGDGQASPIRENTTTNCTQYVDVFTGSDFTCATILADFGITAAQFFQWNPSVGADCGNLWIGYRYCVIGPGYVDTDPADGDGTSVPTSTMPTAGPPGPTQTGQPSNCNKWYIAQSGDSCSKIESQFGITSAQFFKWNPAVSTDCSKGFLAGFAYCVGTSDTTSSTTTTKLSTTSEPLTSITKAPSTTSKASSAISTPSPIQTGVASNCTKFAMAKSGDTCPAFASANGITPAQLYSWNTVLGRNGVNCDSSFWANEWYCVGHGAGA